MLNSLAWVLSSSESLQPRASIQPEASITVTTERDSNSDSSGPYTGKSDIGENDTGESDTGESDTGKSGEQ